jgi:hypothetical protein
MDSTYVYEVDINDFVHCSQLANLLFISHLVFCKPSKPNTFCNPVFYMVIAKRDGVLAPSWWTAKNGDFNAFLLGAVTSVGRKTLFAS